MGAIAHYIEDAGVPTTSISLVRENTERIRPPRALWVPFEFGRPFGAPNEPEFQLDVVRAVLTLLERTDGNVILKEFPKDAPGQNAADSMESVACPMRFRVPAPGDAAKLLSRVLSEISQLAPWHEVFLEKNGRSIAGVSKMPIADAARILDEIRSTGRATSIQETELGTTLRYATEDLRNWYLEAASARPGGSASTKQLAVVLGRNNCRRTCPSLASHVHC